MTDLPENVSYTGEKCPDCGEPLRQFDMSSVGGRVLPLMCKCRRDKLDDERKREDLRRRQENYQRLLDESGIPKTYKSCDFNNFLNRDDLTPGEKESLKNAKSKCKAYADNYYSMRGNGTGIIFFGNTGGGKTHLAAAVADAVMRMEYSVKFSDVPDLLCKIQGTFGKQSVTVEDIIRPLLNCSLLILDDLGAEKASDWSTSVLHNLINQRYSGGKPTIITTNLMANELFDTNPNGLSPLNVRTIDRLMDTRNRRFMQVTIKVRSYRRA